MRLLIVVRSLLLVYLLYLAFFLLFHYHPEQPGYSPPFVIFILDSINLFIHEAGHLFFRPFGMWLHILAGSLFQVLLPLALVIVTFREKPGQILLPCFWLGESMINVSAYIKDAPFMKLKLIARGLTHDWNYLIGGNTETAGILGWIVFGFGIVLVFGSISFGVYQIVVDLRAQKVDTIA
jgi:hypothetical protein